MHCSCGWEQVHPAVRIQPVRALFLPLILHSSSPLILSSSHPLILSSSHPLILSSSHPLIRSSSALALRALSSLPLLLHTVRIAAAAHPRQAQHAGAGGGERYAG